MCFVSIPIWRKVKEQKAKEEETKVVSVPQLLKIPIARSSLGIYFGSCAIESVCLAWGSTFLVNSKGLTPDKAAQMITFYFLGMTIGRFMSGIIVNKVNPKTIIVVGEMIVFTAIIMTKDKFLVLLLAIHTLTAMKMVKLKLFLQRDNH